MHSLTEGITIDLSSFLHTELESSSHPKRAKVRLLYYSEDIVTLHWQRRDGPNSDRIMVVDTRSQTPQERRLLKSVQLESTLKIFARHTSRYLYYGTYSSVGSQGHYEWEVRGISLDSDNHPLSCNALLQLHGFFGTDIGSTIAFEIHDGYFYAISNQTSFEVEEIDWTSFYHCIRFPIDAPIPESVESNRKLWRRQHDEGVIHDSWTDLSLQVDETTGELMIVEARREYRKSCSRQVRTYYVTEFISAFDSPVGSADGSPVLEATTGPMLPWDDAYVQTLDASNNPNYAPSEPRYNWNFHPEIPLQSTPGRSFILARTKFRAYNYSCSAFLDLVEDDRCCVDAYASCLRLRIGSRRVAPLEWKSLEHSMPQLLSTPALVSDVAYRHSPVMLWPPPASTCPCSKRLHRILDPSLVDGPSHSKTITGVMDERSLVYMVRPGRSFASDDEPMGFVINVSFNKSAVPPPTVENALRGQMTEDFEWHWDPEACGKGICH